MPNEKDDPPDTYALSNTAGNRGSHLLVLFAIVCVAFISYRFWTAPLKRAADIEFVFKQCGPPDPVELCNCYREDMEAQLSVMDYVGFGNVTLQVMDIRSRCWSKFVP
jgi:hypothetical protein